MQARAEELARHDAAVLVISLAPPEALAAYQEHLGLPFPIASDDGLATYRAYGLERGTWWRVWHPRVLLRYLGLLLAGRRLQRPRAGEDVRQLGGDFLIDAQGIIRYAHASARPDDRPPVADVLRALGYAG